MPTNNYFKVVRRAVRPKVRAFIPPGPAGERLALWFFDDNDHDAVRAAFTAASAACRTGDVVVAFRLPPRGYRDQRLKVTMPCGAAGHLLGEPSGRGTRSCWRCNLVEEQSSARRAKNNGTPAN